MPVIMIAELTIHDRTVFSRYVEKVGKIVAQYGGVYLARDFNVKPLAGGWSPDCMVLVRFPSRQEMKSCFSSAEYLAVAPLREMSADTRSVLVEGIDGEG